MCLHRLAPREAIARLPRRILTTAVTDGVLTRTLRRQRLPLLLLTARRRILHARVLRAPAICRNVRNRINILLHPQRYRKRRHQIRLQQTARDRERMITRSHARHRENRHEIIVARMTARCLPRLVIRRVVRTFTADARRHHHANVYLRELPAERYRRQHCHPPLLHVARDGAAVNLPLAVESS